MRPLILDTVVKLLQRATGPEIIFEGSRLAGDPAKSGHFLKDDCPTPEGTDDQQNDYRLYDDVGLEKKFPGRQAVGDGSSPYFHGGEEFVFHRSGTSSDLLRFVMQVFKRGAETGRKSRRRSTLVNTSEAQFRIHQQLTLLKHALLRF